MIRDIVHTKVHHLLNRLLEINFEEMRCQLQLASIAEHFYLSTVSSFQTIVLPINYRLGNQLRRRLLRPPSAAAAVCYISCMFLYPLGVSAALLDQESVKPLTPLQEMSSAASTSSTSQHKSASEGPMSRALDSIGMCDIYTARDGYLLASTECLSAVFSLDSTTEKLRRASYTMAIEEMPSLGGTFVPGEPVPTQEDLLNVSDSARMAYMRQKAESRYLASAAMSPEKGRVMSASSLSLHSNKSDPEAKDQLNYESESSDV